ncbi:hypothetical protein CLV56_2799 [Mumia flava]|uniref:LysM domain-containing protein n=1 Tax=Mumia flava TaxID=1348852 RepID=A0A0B2BMP6_9ACTN|nr:LysM domain-containing protein [Mumia flava]PJJ58548.1 hypothetical protein CLV56_2799 [Mumia flava]
MRRAATVVLALAPVVLSVWLVPRASAAALVLAATFDPSVRQPAGAGATPGDATAAALAAIPTVVAAVATGWLAATVLLACLARVLGTGTGWLLRATPRPWRWVIMTLAGCSTIALAPTSVAADGSSAHPGRAERAPLERVVGLALPDRPARSVVRASDAPPADRSRPALPEVRPRTSAPGSGGHYVVRAGDSLWSIAARELAGSRRSATVRVVDRRWRRWYAANRSVVGPDPDLLVPGTPLRPPGRTTARRPTSAAAGDAARPSRSPAATTLTDPREHRGDR